MRLNITLHRAGDCGLLAELQGEVTSSTLLAAGHALQQQFAPMAQVAGHSSVLMLFDRAPEPPEDMVVVLDVSGDAPLQSGVRHHSIAVSFSAAHAPDLPEVLTRLGLSKDEFLRTLSACTLRARFTGFRPGFAYLDGLPSSWDLPRRPTSRTRIPRGSLGLAAGMAGFYPDDSPGGWNIVGRTSELFWDPVRTQPSLLSLGDVVHIEPVETLTPATPLPYPPQPSTANLVATCITSGQQTLIVSLPDIRRYGHSLSPGGAFDPELAKRANQRAGNAENATLLECTLVGPELRFEIDCRVVWEGASIAWKRNDQPVDETEITMRRGDVLRLGRLTSGLRGWLAFSGGGLQRLDEAFMIAPRRLARGASLRRGDAAGASTNHDPAAPRTSLSEIAVTIGPHDLDPESLRSLLEDEWTVSRALDRTGIRLQPARSHVAAPASIPSTGMQFGTIQLHPNGELVVMGPDHPITGGYLQPFTVVSGDLWKLAQLQPGERVQLVKVAV